MKRRIIDPHYHASIRSSNDYEALALSGVDSILEPCHRTRQKFDSESRYIDLLLRRVEDERMRSKIFGVNAYFSLGAMPCDFSNTDLFYRVLEKLISLKDDNIFKCYGEVEFLPDMENAEELFIYQLEFFGSKNFPVIVNIPHRNRKLVWEETIRIFEAQKNNAKIKVENILLDGLYISEINQLRHFQFGALGLPVSPILDALFVVFKKNLPQEILDVYNNDEATDYSNVIFNTSIGFGYGDPWGFAKVADTLHARGIGNDLISDLFFGNAKKFFKLP
ncbi:MAG: hypothetical protein WAT19_04105 [Ferruginibacter sp.]